METNKSNFDLPLRHVVEYDAAAEWCANRGLKGEIGDLLPENMSSDVVGIISNDPESFEKRVKDFAYAKAMNKIVSQVWPKMSDEQFRAICGGSSE